MADITDLLGDATPYVVGGVVLGSVISGIAYYKGYRRDLAKDFSEDKGLFQLWGGEFMAKLKYTGICLVWTVGGGLGGFLVQKLYEHLQQ